MRGALLALWAVFLLTLALPGKARAEPASEADFINAINRERISRGLPELVVHRDLVDDARMHASKMADAGLMFHNAGMASATSGWELMAENVGWGYGVEGIMQAFMSSSSHRANILGPYSYVGVGTATSGHLYVDIVFMQAPPIANPHQPPFWDDELTAHEGDIEALWRAGITNGCREGQFCSWAPVTRGQMAAFLVNGLGLSSGSDHFSDTEGNQFESQISALASAGITEGCAPGLYCPDEPVTRGQMAAFLVRGLELGSSSTDHFWDDQGNLFESEINALASAGITMGCALGRFCPNDAVERGEMASFLVRGLDLN